MGKSKLFLSVFCSFLFLVNGVNAEAASNASELKKELEKLKKDVKALSKKLKAIERNGLAKTTGGNLFVRNRSKSKTFKIRGSFQSDLDIFDGAYNADNGGNTGSDYFPRRISTTIGGKYYDWDYSFSLDFSDDEDFDGQLTVARFRYSGFKNGPIIKFGKIREDISLEAISSSRWTTSISRSMLANTMSPYFSWGIDAYQYIEPAGLRYSLGIFEGRGFGSSNKDEDDGLTLATTGRLTWAPLREGDKILHLGLWVSQRKFGDNDNLSMSTRGEVRETNVRLLDYAAGGSKYTVDDLTQSGLELASVWGPFSFQAEYAERKINAIDPSNSNTYEGHYAQLSYFLTGEHRKYYAPNATFGSPRFGKQPVWEVFVKSSNFSAISDDMSQGTEVDVDTLGINYYPNRRVKFMLNHIWADVSGPGTNDLVGTYDDGKAITFRGQFSF